MPSMLVTGGAGFIGANFVHYWIREHPEDHVIVLDALTYAGNRANLAEVEGHAGLRFVHGDIRDENLLEELLREEKLDTIVHFAAESHVDRSIKGPDLFLDVNVGGTHSLLKAACAVWLEGKGGRPHRFHHVSTDEVYGSLDTDDPPFTEENPYAPNSPYAASKAAADHLVRAYHRTYGLTTTISNCSNNYGPYQYPEKLLSLSIVRLLDGKMLPVYGDGLNIRDWLHVEDHCRGLELILEKGRVGATYNVSANNERTNLALVRLLCGILDQLFEEDPELAERYPDAPPAQGEASESRIVFVPDRPGHDRRYALDARRISDELGFQARVVFDEGLKRTLRWYLDHESWWRELMDERYSEWIEDQYAGT